MRTGTLTEKIAHLEQDLQRARQLSDSYRSQATTCEIEVIRLNQQIKTLQLEATGLKEQNSKLVDRICGLLQDQELKQS